MQHALAQVRQGTVARFEASLTAANRQHVCVDVIATPVLNKAGEPIRMLTIWRDIISAQAARDATEQARRAAERTAAKLTSVLESTLDCIAVVDCDWRLTYLNANARRLLALGDEALGQSLWSRYPEARRGAFAAQCEKSLASREPITFEGLRNTCRTWIGGLRSTCRPLKRGCRSFFATPRSAGARSRNASRCRRRYFTCRATTH
ncbi:PAS domain-containing protein [Pandoraea sputorum]|uniref:PAS domain-containing protein n=1 Tax=Pandoraea sputorum TaxID=93222 RepID=UPI001240A8ED|nr:PAS domain-containing protein [Pandoraea sputorum]VVE54868.1 diguanylate cyclase [Pandoraea sputorum]